MNAQEASLLVRTKYLDESKGITTGEKAEQYKAAYKRYPAMMRIAHHIVAREIEKSVSSGTFAFS